MDVKRLPDNEMAKASCSGGFRDIAFSPTESRAYDSKAAIAEEIGWTSEREGKRVNKVLAYKA